VEGRKGYSDVLDSVRLANFAETYLFLTTTHASHAKTHILTMTLYSHAKIIINIFVIF
jgi:hypothetical protein